MTIHPSGMQAVILCGGLGTRLREETEFKPKPMVEIGDRPILWHIMKIYARFGVRRFVLCLGYKGEIIRDYFLNYRHRHVPLQVDLASANLTVLRGRDTSQMDAEDWEVRLIDTGKDAQTGARIKSVLPYVDGDNFFATYGDGVSDIDLAALLDHHHSCKRLATVTTVHPSSRYGEIDIQHGVVTTFREKPQVNDGWINGGFFVFNRSAFDLIDDQPGRVLETDVLPQLVARDQLAAYRHEGFWQSMDTYRETLLLNDLWKKGNAPWMAG